MAVKEKFNKKNYWLVLAGVLGLGLITVSLVTADRGKSKYEATKSEYTKVQKQLANTKLKADSTAPSVTTTVLDNNANAATQNINQLMTLMYSYQDGSQYEKNRTDAQKLVNNQDFFNNYFKDAKDADGQNSVDVLKRSSSLLGTTVFKMGDHEYLVKVNADVKSGTTTGTNVMIYQIQTDNDNKVTGVTPYQNISEKTY